MTLQDWRGCVQSSRQLWTCGQAFFTGLTPGPYLLSLRRGPSGPRLVLLLAPGARITQCHDPASGCCRWYRQPGPCTPFRPL